MVDKNIEGIPDADLGPIMDDLKKVASDVKPDVVKQDDTLDLAQFKNPKDLLKSYKEVQAAFTRTSQDNKSSKEEIARLQQELNIIREQSEIARLSQPSYQPQPQQDLSDPDVQLEQKIQTLRIADILEEEAEKNKGEFQERYAYAQLVARDYPQLARSPKGVRKLFELGDKVRSDQFKRNADKALDVFFGEPLTDEEKTKLRTMVKGSKSQTQTQTNRNAYMPDTSTSTKTGSQLDRTPDYDSEINEAASKGDVDGVISATFRRKLAE